MFQIEQRKKIFSQSRNVRIPTPLILAFLLSITAVALFFSTRTEVPHNAELMFTEHSARSGILGSVIPASCESGNPYINLQETPPYIYPGSPYHQEFSGCATKVCWNGSMITPATTAVCPYPPVTAPSITANTATYASPGTWTFTVPPGVTSITATVIGGGGGGGGAGHFGDTHEGHGGGSGGVTTQILSVTPGQNITVTVGAGGCGGAYWNYSHWLVGPCPSGQADPRNGGHGGNSSFGPIIATGGGGGGWAIYGWGVGSGGSPSGGWGGAGYVYSCYHGGGPGGYNGTGFGHGGNGGSCGIYPYGRNGYPGRVSLSYIVTNQAPTVNAGSDAGIALPTSSTGVSGASATDPEGLAMTYLWENTVRPGGAPVPTITNGTTLNPTFSNLTTAGTYTFRLTATDSAGLTASDLMNVTVVSTPSLASASATNCSIALNQSSCNSTVSWSITNPSSPSIRQAGSQFSTSASSGGTSRSVSYGDTTFQFYDGATLLGTRTVNATCSGGIWNGSSCVTIDYTFSVSPLGPMSYGSSTNVIWNVTNAGTLSCEVTRTGASTWSGASGSQVDIPPMTRTYQLRCDGVGLISETVTIDRTPTVRVTPRIVPPSQADNALVHWDTNNEDETQCWLNGGDFQNQYLPSTNGTANTGNMLTTITARTTITLSCPDPFDPINNPPLVGVTTVELLPRGFES